MIRLTVYEDERVEERIFEGSAVDIGRSRECDLFFADERLLSRRHCRLRLVDGHCEIEDLSSRNGLRVNGIFLQRGILEVGDEVALGSVRVELVAYGPDESEPERVRPCLECGHLMPFSAPTCPRCSQGTPPRLKRRILAPDAIPGYRLLRRLGAGGMGIVFEAERSKDGSTCALKVLKPHLARHPAYLARYVEETRVLTLFRHDNIVRVEDHGTSGDLVYIDMELVRGESVRHLIRVGGPIPERRALKMIWEITLALDYAARQRVIHGDVKPSNFLLDEKGTAKLCDFGLARFHELGSPLKHAGMSPEHSGRKGTAAYAAPERLLTAIKPNAVGDIYSLGVSLYQMLTGVLPFGSNRFASRRARPEPPDLRELAPATRAATAMLVAHMMEADPARRYQSYRELQDDLALLLD
ncbi:MAG: FHA domain-containing serine/threonine-protein kinase [Planctomycetota bacterium]